MAYNETINYLSLDAQIIIGVEATTMANVLISLHNNTLALFAKENKPFDSTIKASNETLSLLCGMGLKRTKNTIKKLTGKIKGVQLVKVVDVEGRKSKSYKINTKGLETINHKAEIEKLKWLRGYGQNKWTEEKTTQEIYDQLSKEILQGYKAMKRKRNV